MAFGGPTRGSGIRAAALSALVWSIVPPSLVLPAQTTAQTQLPGYAQADDAFMRLTLDERVKLQVLLTAAGYWPDVPEAGFRRPFVQCGLAIPGRQRLPADRHSQRSADGSTDRGRWRRTSTTGGSQLVRHPMASSQIWVPMGLPLAEESTPTGPWVRKPAVWVLCSTTTTSRNSPCAPPSNSLYDKLRRDRRQDLLFETLPE